MPYALYKDGDRISGWYPSRMHVEVIAIERNAVVPGTENDRKGPTLLAGYAINLSSAEATRPSELALAQAFEAVGIPYVHESQDSHTTLGLDFKAADVFFEVKQCHSPRSVEQCARASNVVLLQGEKACAFLIGLLHAKAELDALRAEINGRREPGEGVSS